jgi:hypothetical protein
MLDVREVAVLTQSTQIALLPGTKPVKVSGIITYNFVL